MRRGLIAAALLAAVAVAAAAPCVAQPVAALEVTKPSKLATVKELTQHQRIEATVNEILERVKALQGVKPVDPGPIKPVDPAPPTTPVDPAKPNPFIAWREQGLSLVDVAVWRLGRGLTDAELEQAYAAGYPRGGAPAGGSGGSRNGFHVTVENSPRVNVLQNGQPYTFLLAHPGTVRVFGVSGTQLNRVNGRDVIGGDDIQVAGTTVVLTVEGIGAFGPPEVGVQLVGQ